MPTDKPNRRQFDRINYNLEDTNGTGTFDRGDDIQSSTKETLGDYLSQLTRNSNTQNAFTIAPDSNEHVTFVDDNGKPSPLVTGQGSGEETFIDQVATDARAYFETLSNSGIFDEANPTNKLLSNLIDKRQQEDGHKLLSTIKGTPLDTSGQNTVPGKPKKLIEKKIAGVLLNNRFNPGPNTPYIENGELSDSFGQKQDKFGEYVADAEVGYEVEDLSRIACSLLLKATGRLNADENPDDYDTGSILGVGSGLTTVRIGSKKLDPRDLYASNGYRGDELTTIGLQDAELRQAAEGNIDGFDTPGSSFGQMWSHLEQFAPTGAYSASPIALAVSQLAVISSYTAFVTIFAGLLTPGAGFKAAGTEPDEGEIMKKGQHRTEKLGILEQVAYPLRRLFGIPELKNSYNLSVAAGLGFFQATTLLGASGFVVNVQRAVIRDTIDSVDFAGKFSGGLVSDILGLGSLIYDITTSKSFRFTQILAIIGDKVLTNTINPRRQYHSAQIAGYSGQFLDEVDESGNSRVGKSRRGSGNSDLRSRETDLVWRNSSAPSMYLFPKNLTQHLLDNTSPKKYVPQTDHYMNITGKNRLPADFVKQVEDRLDAEYMPFYFHDLRTNEIIGFHAFLESLTDAFAADWSEVKGIGRVDPVMIYGSTKRKISMKFIAAATNKEDFDQMWFKINKLITLVYPQWSKGRTLKGGSDYEYTQPFSQIKTASPLVRIRMGDVLRSNYSKFGLARLFGVTEDSFTVGGASKPNLETEEKLREFQRVYSGLQNPGQLVYRPLDKVKVRAGKKYKTVGAATLGGTTTSTTPPNKIYLDSDMEAAVDIIVGPETSDPNNINFFGQINSVYNVTLENKFEISGPFRVDRGLDGVTIQVTNEDIVYTKEAAINTAKLLSGFVEIPALGAELNAYETALADFLNPKENTIVRSFESARGKGLAGAITAIDFNWINNNTTWETAPDSRAPKMCEIMIQFSPIHDIQPGLDHNGFNRAPVYNVGEIAGGIGFDPYTDAEPEDPDTIPVPFKKSEGGIL